MVLNIHDTTPASQTPKHLKWMFAGLFVLIYSIFAMMSFCVIYYGESILFGVFMALYPIFFLFWFLWDQRNLSNSYVEIFQDRVVVTEFPFGRKSVKDIPISTIDHAKLILPSSVKLRGPRIKNLGIPYVVFYDRQEKQLFKLLAYPEALQFQQRITKLVDG